MENIHIAIEGNIGAGKTTFCESFAKTFSNMTVCPEPINQWQSFGTNKTNLLNLYYSDLKQFAYDFQHVALISKMKQVFPCNNLPKLVERSILAQSKVFIPILFKNKFLTELQKDILLQNIDNHMPFLKPDVIIYLKIDPNEALQRITKRNRIEEKNLTLETLKEINDGYENWLKQEIDIPVIIVQNDQELDPIFIFKKICEIYPCSFYKPKIVKYYKLWYFQMQYNKAVTKMKKLITENLQLNRSLTLSQDIIYQYSDLTDRANVLINRYKLKYNSIQKELDYRNEISKYK